MGAWPDGARGALCLTFDNLGEAAEIELGASGEEDAGGHFTAGEVAPALLDRLAKHGVAATFFVEGLNADLYPETLRAIGAAGHEVAYHAWRHEEWGALSAEEQAANLKRGTDAFGALGLGLSGFRPPGGALGAGGTQVLRDAGLAYCSPAGSGAGTDDGLALLPFQWRHVDATSLLPPLAPVREQMTGSPDAIDAEAFVAHLGAEIDRLAADGGFAAVVLHLYLIREWLGWEKLEALLDRVAAAAAGGSVWVATCAEVAAHALADPASFAGATELDAASWA